jgi:Flp pilus assembly protein TadD
MRARIAPGSRWPMGLEPPGSLPPSVFCFASPVVFDFLHFAIHPLFHMKQVLRLIAGILLAAGVPAAFGSGSQPVSESTAKPAKTVDAAAIYNQGVALMHEKRYSEAVADFQKAVQAKPDFAEAHNNLAYCLRQQGPANFHEALAHYDKAIQLKPDLAEAYEYRGVLFVKMNRKNDAEKDLAKLQQLNPKLASKLEYAMKHNGQEVAGY